MGTVLVKKRHYSSSAERDLLLRSRFVFVYIPHITILVPVIMWALDYGSLATHGVACTVIAMNLAGVLLTDFLVVHFQNRIHRSRAIASGQENPSYRDTVLALRKSGGHLPPKLWLVDSKLQVAPTSIGVAPESAVPMACFAAKDIACFTVTVFGIALICLAIDGFV